MEEVPNTDTKRQPLWKQLLGAVVGGSLALGLYYSYEFAQPKVAAYLTLPPAERTYDLGSSHIADKTTDEGNRKRLLSRNVRVAQQMQKNSDSASNIEALNTVDDHSMDIAWPGHNPDDPKYTEVTGIVPEVQEEVEEEVEVLEEADENPQEWEKLWGEIQNREHEAEVEHIPADNLSDTGFGLGFIAAGAVGGALGVMRKKRK